MVSCIVLKNGVLAITFQSNAINKDCVVKFDEIPQFYWTLFDAINDRDITAVQRECSADEQKCWALVNVLNWKAFKSQYHQYSNIYYRLI